MMLYLIKNRAEICNFPYYSVVAGNPASVVKYYDFKRKEWVKKDRMTI